MSKSLFLLLAFGGLWFLIYRQKTGQPVFMLASRAPNQTDAFQQIAQNAASNVVNQAVSSGTEYLTSQIDNLFDV